MDTVKKGSVFASKWGFAQIFLFFVIGCIIGVYYEQILYLVQTGIWESRKGIIYGPFNPIYGFGFAFFVLFLGKYNDSRKWYETFVYSALIGGVAEFSLSLIGEFLFNSVSWNYAGQFLNVLGRTTIPYMMFWGMGGVLFMKFVYPFTVNLLGVIPVKTGKVLVNFLVVFMSLNMLVSYTALIRQAARLNGIDAKTFIGKFCDKVYNDDFLHKIYPNMIHNE